MHGINHKLAVLSCVARALGTREVTWAVGGSLLLYLKGIASDFADIDVMVAEEDAETAEDVLRSLGHIQPIKQSAGFKTRFFRKFNVAGVALDVMAGFAIVNKGREYYFPLMKEHIKDCAVVNATKIPLHSLEEWLLYYQLMGRDEKVRLIDAHGLDW